MSQVIKHYCDWKGCKAERAGNDNIGVFSHTSADASGNGHETWYATFDLCANHLLFFVRKLIENSEQGKKVCKETLQLVKDLEISFELR